MRRLERVLTVAVAVLGCAAPHQEPSATDGARQRTGALAEGMLARVGSSDIAASTVLDTALAQQVPVAVALEQEIRDALYALGAIAQHLDQDLGGRASTRGQLARLRLRRIQAEAGALPPTDEEVEVMTAAHFVEFDRPEAFRVIHAVVRVGRDEEHARRLRAEELAAEIAGRAASVSTPTEFRSAAESVDCKPYELRVEELKPVAEDGRVVDLQNPGGGERYAPEFARAAARLTRAGQKSGVVESPFGFHVLMLLEKQPEHRIPLEERRRALAAEIVADRAKRRLDEMVRRLRSESPPVVEAVSDALLQGLVVPRR